MTGPGRADRMFALILRLLPREFRERHGHEIAQVFRAERHESGRRRWPVCLRAAADILRTAPREHLSILRHDVRHALRALARDRGFAAAALLTLAIGIGGTTAVFGLVNTIFLRPLPWAASDRLVRIDQFSMAPNGERRLTTTFGRNVDALEARTDLFDGVVAQISTGVTWLGGDAPERIPAVRVSAGWSALLGVRTIAGRHFTDEEARLGSASRAVIVSERLWRGRLGGRPVFGDPVHLDGGAHDVVGVLPDEFRFPYDAEIWMPDRIGPAEGSVLVLARCRPGVTVE